eukprot:6888416-Prymnesium_polylepis.1
MLTQHRGDLLALELALTGAERRREHKLAAALSLLQAERRRVLGLVKVPRVAPARLEHVDGAGTQRVGQAVSHGVREAASGSPWSSR